MKKGLIVLLIILAIIQTIGIACVVFAVLSIPSSWPPVTKNTIYELPEAVLGFYSAADGSTLTIEKTQLLYKNPEGTLYRRNYVSFENVSANVYELPANPLLPETAVKLVFVSESTVEYYVDNHLLNVFHKERK